MLKKLEPCEHLTTPWVMPRGAGSHILQAWVGRPRA